MAYFSLFPPTCLLLSLVLSVFCLANRSFVLFFLRCYDNMIWQCFCNLKLPTVRGAAAKRETGTKEKGEESKEKEERRKRTNQDTARACGIRINISAGAALFVHPPFLLT